MIGVEDDIGLSEAVRLEIKAHIRGYEPLRPGDPFVAQPQCPTNAAMSSIGANEPRSTKRLLSLGRADCYRYAVIALRDGPNLMVPAHFGARYPQQVTQDSPCQRRLPEVQVVRIGGVLRPQHRHVEVPEKNMITRPVVIRVLENPDLLQIRQQAQFVEALHYRRVVNHGTGLIGDSGFRIENHCPDAGAGEPQRDHEADRPRSRNHHAVDSFHHAARGAITLPEMRASD